MADKNLRLLIALVAVFLVTASVYPVKADQENTGSSNSVAEKNQQEVGKILVSFKLDPRLTRSLYMGDRWVSPPTFNSVMEGKSVTVDARAVCLNKEGKKTNILADWIPLDAEMLKITRVKGNEVKITVNRDGSSSLKVGSQGVYKTLNIKATYKENSIQAEIVQQD